MLVIFLQRVRGRGCPNTQLYDLPGRGGRLETGLGEALTARGFTLTGRETVDEFARLSFAEQIQLVAEDLSSHFWHEDCQVVANSYGAYLFLHAQTLMPAYVGKVLLLSPIVGAFSSGGTGTYFVPPRSRVLMNLVQEGKYPIPKRCEIHVGELDWQSDPDNVAALAKLTGWNMTVVRGAGHMLPKDYVGMVLDRWLIGPSDPTQKTKNTENSAIP